MTFCNSWPIVPNLSGAIMKYDLSRFDGPVRDQLTLGACMAFAITNCVDAVMRQAGHEVAPLSPLGLYHRTLVQQGTPNVDYGSIPVEAFKVARDVGIGLESAWSYVPSNLHIAPPAETVIKVESFVPGNIYQSPDNLATTFKGLLAQGKPIVLVFDVYSYFMTESGPMADQVRADGRGAPIGIHAVVLNSADDLGRYYGVHNQWGTSWGDGGYGSIAYKEFTPDPTNYYSTGLREFYTLDKVGGLDLTWSEQRLDVAREYAVILGRAPDVGGLNFWAGLNLSDIAMADYLITSAEGAVLYGSDTSSAFVTDVYREALGRAPDASGLAFWSGVLDAGTVTRGAVFVNIMDSAEAAPLVANKENLSAYMAIAMQSDGTVDTSVYIDMVTTDAQHVEVIKVGIPDLNP